MELAQKVSSTDLPMSVAYTLKASAVPLVYAAVTMVIMNS